MVNIRKLVYEEKTSVCDFGITKDGSLNELLYGEWLLTRKELRGDDCRILKVLNDTYYICTLALLRPDIRLQISYVLNEIKVPSVVIPLARLYLSRIEHLPKATKLFLNSTLSVMEDGWEANLNSLEELASKNNQVISSDLFAPRVLTEELIVGLSEMEWRNATNNYDKDTIQKIVTALAKDRDVWQMLTEAIKTAAQKYDADFEFEEVKIIDVDEDGLYTQTVKVPRNPYGSDGNEILEPLKRAGVYQFCDDLREKFDELAITAQPLGAGGKDEEKDSTPCSRQESDMSSSLGDKSCFKTVSPFVKERVKEAIKTYCNSQADYALLEVTLYDHGLLKDRNAHLPFLRELHDWGFLLDACEGENLEGKLDKYVASVRDKHKKLPIEGYKTWRDRPKDKLKCEEFGRILGETIPYNR